MADTTFTDGVTLSDDGWFQDLNNVYYRLTANRIPYATGAALTSSANLTFDGTTLTANTIKVSTTGWTISPTAATGLTAQGNHRFAHGTSALATNATEGFLHIQSCAGTPTGVPSSIPAGQVPAVVNSTNSRLYLYLGAAWAAADGLATPQSAIAGYTYANSGADSISIAAGQATDATGAYRISGSALTKSITSNWVVGSAQGMLDTGAVGNSDYYLWAIARSDTGVVDYLASLSSTAPTMPANYDFKRLIGWFKRVGGTNVAFHVYETEGGGVEMNWDVPTLDVNLANTLTTARRTDAVKVPLNFSVTAHINASFNDGTGSTLVWICCPDQTDAAPSATVAPLSNMGASDPTVGNTSCSAQLFIRTSATGTIAARSNTASIDLYAVSTMGFRWARRV